MLEDIVCLSKTLQIIIRRMTDTVFREDPSDLCAINKTQEQQSDTTIQISNNFDKWQILVYNVFIVKHHFQRYRNMVLPCLFSI